MTVPSYTPDLSRISIEEFKNEFKVGRILPSRRPLLQDIDQCFRLFRKENIKTVRDLKRSISSSHKRKALAEKTGISENYLILLAREVGSLEPTPIVLSKIPAISTTIVQALSKSKIATTKDLFCHIIDQEHRKAFCKELGLSSEEVLWLARIVDVSRIKWVGPKLAGLIVSTKFNTVEKLAKADPMDVFHALNEAKESAPIYSGPLGVDDVDSWVLQVIRKTPLVIQF